MHKQHRKRDAQAHPGPARGAVAKQPAATADKSRDAPAVSTADIRLCAYWKWESAGKPDGDGIQFWLEAENELLRGK